MYLKGIWALLAFLFWCLFFGAGIEIGRRICGGLFNLLSAAAAEMRSKERK